MKLPRWLIVAMFASSALLILTAAAWWWVTWPERTAREYVELMAAGKRDEADRLIRPQPVPPLWWFDLDISGQPPNWNPVEIYPESRALWDIITARQVFRIPTGPDLVVQCGTIERPFSEL